MGLHCWVPECRQVLAALCIDLSNGKDVDDRIADNNSPEGDTLWHGSYTDDGQQEDSEGHTSKVAGSNAERFRDDNVMTGFGYLRALEGFDMSTEAMLLSCCED